MCGDIAAGMLSGRSHPAAALLLPLELVIRVATWPLRAVSLHIRLSVPTQLSALPMGFMIAERDHAEGRPRALEGAEWNELAVLEVGALCASRYGRFHGYETSTATLPVRASSSAVPATLLSHGGTQSTDTGSCWCAEAVLMFL